MNRRRSVYLKKFLGITALMLLLAAVQSPLSRPTAALESVTARSGMATILKYNGEIERAMIFQRRTATLTASGSGRLVIHGHEPGKTSLLIHFKSGDSKVYEVVVIPG
jgi:hypothetical protein